MRGRWVEVARRRQRAGGLPADADPEEVGQALLALMPGLILQHLLVGDVTPAAFGAGARALMAGRP